MSDYSFAGAGAGDDEEGDYSFADNGSLSSSADGLSGGGTNLGSAMGMAGQMLKGFGAFSQGMQNAKIAEYNAVTAQQNADLVESQGAEAARRALVNSRKMVGAETAGYGASGVSGVSAEMVLRNSAAQGELNALTIKNNADIKATSYSNEAALDRYREGNDQAAGVTGLVSGLLGAAGSVAGMI